MLNFSRATRPLWLLPVGVLYFALYYGVFRLVIVSFDLKTPGRDALERGAAAPPAPPAERTRAWISALGGAANLVSVDACTTRLRLLVANQAAVDEGALRQLGVRGLVRPSANALQVVIGTSADQVAGEIRSALHGSAGSAAGAPAAAPLRATPAPEPVATAAPDAAALLAALGGRGNVRAVQAAASRLRVSVGDAALIDRAALRGLGLRGVAIPAADCVHVIVGPAADAACAALRGLLG